MEKLIALISFAALLISCGGSDPWNALNYKTGSSRELTAFSFVSPSSVGIIDETSKVISIAVPYGTAVTALVAEFTTTGSNVSVSGITQKSGVTPNDFTYPVTYTVTAIDGKVSTYTVNVYVAGTDEKDITAFSIAGYSATIANTTISLVLPAGTSLLSLIPEISFTGVSISPASGTARDFTYPVVYTVNAQDGSYKNYTVTVTAAAGNAKDITSFVILGIDGTISGTSIYLTLPFGTDLSAQIATLAITGSSVSPPSGSVQNFTAPVTYTVSAADGSTKAYTVFASLASDTSKDITSFSVEGVNCAISGTTISGTLMSTANLKALYPVILYNGVNIVPASGAKANFNSPVVYTVTAADGSTKAYTVTITKYPAPTGITLSPASLYFQIGDFQTVTASVLPPTAYQAVVWNNVNPSAASVVVSGNDATITGVAVGMSPVRVTSVDAGFTATCYIGVESGLDITEGATAPGIGQKTTILIPTGNSFAIIQTTPDSIGTAISFPTGTNDGGTGSISTPFLIAGTEVSYRLWGSVYAWARQNGYSFGYLGSSGSSGYGSLDQPVTSITWRDAMVWCNALTEYYNAENGASADLTPVYYSDASYATVMRTSTAVATYQGSLMGSQDYPYIYAGAGGNTSMANCTATGFRLPTAEEWEYSARYIGTTLPANANYVLAGGTYYTNGASAAGGLNTANIQSATTLVSVYSVNSGGTTAPVGLKNATTLGLLDMSGNAQEYCFEWSNQSQHKRFAYGGMYNQSYAYIELSSNTGFICYNIDPGTGFRPARNR